MEVTLYTIGCPKCEILKEKLESKKINFNMVSDIETLTEKNYVLLPVLEVDGSVMNYYDAVRWVNEQKGGM